MSLRDPRILNRSLDELQRKVLDELARTLKRRYGDELVRLSVFGSRARGDADSQSDIDLLVVLDIDAEREAAETEAVWSAVGDARRLAPRAWVPLSPLVLSLPRYLELSRLGRRIAVDAEREGIPL
jgi:predicted nucleotidyltransferase